MIFGRASEAHLSEKAVFRLLDVPMRKRIALICLGAALSGLLAASAATAAMVGLYRNEMGSTAARAQLIKIAGANCARGGSKEALKVTIGKKTEACSFRTPVLGRDLEIGATERLLSGTPKAQLKRSYLGLELRAGGGVKYQLLVYPLQRKAQLIKHTAEGPEFFDIAKNVPGIMGVNKANPLRLRALQIRTGPEKGRTAVAGFVGAEKVVEGIDALPGDLSGEASAAVVGAANNGDGVVASIDDLVVRAPVHF